MQEKVILNNRQEEILEALKKEQRMTVSELSEKFYVCEMTIRRDLKLLEEATLLKRYHGGAVCTENATESPINIRRYLCEDEKKKLSIKAKKYLANNQSVFIDSSSTCMYLTPLLNEYENIKLFTNSIQTLLLASQFHIPCFITGGEYNEFDMCLIGPSAENYLKNINVDVAFLSSFAFSDDGIISDRDEHQTEVRRTIMKNSKKNIFLFESSKLLKKSTFILCKAEDADDIILIE